MMRIKATPKFMQLAQKIISKEALQELVDVLTLHPEKGVVVSGTNGIRKMRWYTGYNNKGKSSGVRILYYYDKNRIIVLLITLFRKSDKENISAKEKLHLKKILPELLGSYVYD